MQTKRNIFCNEKNVILQTKEKKEGQSCNPNSQSSNVSGHMKYDAQYEYSGSKVNYGTFTIPLKLNLLNVVH